MKGGALGDLSEQQILNCNPYGYGALSDFQRALCSLDSITGA